MNNNDKYKNKGDTMFCTLPTNIPDGYIWSNGFDETLTQALEKYAEAYYHNLQQQILKHNEEEIKLFNYDTLAPSACATPWCLALQDALK